MVLSWHPMALPAVLVLLVAAVLVALVISARPHAPQNQRLAVLLVHGAIMTAAIAGLRWLPNGATGARVLFSLFVTLAILLPYVYVRFLSTLKTPLVRPFERPAGRNVIAGITIAILALWGARPDLFLAGVETIDVEGVGTAWENLPGPLFGPLALFAIATYVYGLLVAISAYRRSTTPSARVRTRAYAVAFGVRDVLTAVNIGLVALLFGPSQTQRILNDLGFPLIDVVFFTLISYGILRHQLFDIDYKIRFALSQSTVALVFGSAFFLGKEVVEAVLPVEGIVFGVGAALMVAAAFRPIQRFGWWVAERIVPTSDRGLERAQRRYDVYRAALEGAVTDGIITQAERSILERIRQQLGLEARDAEALERDVLAAAGSNIRVES